MEKKDETEKFNIGPKVAGTKLHARKSAKDRKP